MENVVVIRGVDFSAHDESFLNSVNRTQKQTVTGTSNHVYLLLSNGVTGFNGDCLYIPSAYTYIVSLYSNT